MMAFISGFSSKASLGVVSLILLVGLLQTVSSQRYSADEVEYPWMRGYRHKPADEFPWMRGYRHGHEDKYNWIGADDDKPAVEYCGNAPADVVFMLDVSRSIHPSDFGKMLDFVANVTRMFDIGRKKTQVGLGTFGNGAHANFQLYMYRDKRAIINAIYQVRFTEDDTTHTDKAIRLLRRQMFTRGKGARPDVPHVAIIITDGRSDNLLMTKYESSIAKSRNINIFAIGIGNAVNKKELGMFASRPSDDYVFFVDSYSFLDAIKEKLAIRTCLLTTPVPTTTTTTTTTTTPTTTTTTTPTTTTTTTTTTTPTTTTTTTPTTTTTTPTTTSTTTTTTTPTTTTTQPEPTTTSWIDVVRGICENKPVDVVFALDSSDGVSAHDFWYQKKFVRDFSLGLDVGQNKTRLGLVLYGSQVKQVFDINSYESLHDALADVYTVQRITGTVKLDEVIRHVRTSSFRRTTTRRDAAQLLVLLTASVPRKDGKFFRVKKEANQARKTGVNIIVVGVGDKVKHDELKVIGGDRHANLTKVEQDFTENLGDFLGLLPTKERRHVFTVDSFRDLGSIVIDMTVEACTAEVAPITVSDQACGARQEADIMFVMDNANVGRKNAQKSLNFMKRMANTVNVSQEGVQLGLIQPDYCIYPEGHSFRLNSDSENVADSLGGEVQDSFAELMKNMRKNGFKKSQGARRQAKKIAVLFVDGRIDEPIRALREAIRAKKRGVEIFVIYVGLQAPQNEVMDMCAYPPQKHMIKAPDYDSLKELESNVIELLCDEL